MEFFAEDCSFDMPCGPDPWGKRFIGKAAVREGLTTYFKGLPDVHYGDDRHWVSGNMGLSEWLLTGTTPVELPIIPYSLEYESDPQFRAEPLRSAGRL